MDRLILKAKEWATNLWEKADLSWRRRRQDYNYRKFIARPGLYDVLRCFSPINDGIFLDVGCGGGSETIYIRDSLAKFGNTGMMYGFDPRGEFIEIAKKKINNNLALSLNFENNSFGKFIEKYKLTGKANLVVSVFVLQDLPDIDEFIKNVNTCLVSSGLGIFLLVHPNFAEKMLRKDALKINKSLNPKNDEISWRFAAEYPIVEENNQTFFVPYFHRTIRDYRTFMSKYFKNIDFINLKLKPEDVDLCRKNHISPFYNHKGNVYYPEIIETESSLIISGVKKL